MGLTTFVVDEAEEWESEEEYDTIKLSIRKKGVKNRVIIILNPTNIDHWIFKNILKRQAKPSILMTYLFKYQHTQTFYTYTLLTMIMKKIFLMSS